MYLVRELSELSFPVVASISATAMSTAEQLQATC